MSFATKSRLATARMSHARSCIAGWRRPCCPTLPTLPDGYRAATIYRPGDERLGLGGDFYDLQTVDGGGLALLIGDVSGHGPRSAALGAALRTSWRSLIQAGVDGPLLVEALTRIAQSEKAGDELFSTLWLGWLDADIFIKKRDCT